MKHVYITPQDCDCKGKVPHCIICEGGALVCKICGLAEGSLTTDCPGEDSVSKTDDIYSGQLDYRDGCGWVEEKNPTNQLWEKNHAGK